jgi:glycosyltransferase involved in cell wall biosynthesis
MSEMGERLRVLQVHSHYAPGWGGEGTVVELERQLLRGRGHVVEQFQTSNAPLKNAHVLRQVAQVPGFLWSHASYRGLRRKISEFKPDIVHVHNTFPMLSPSVFWAARHAGAPVVQTLHNFRHVCANSLLLRDDEQCEECVGHAPWRALRYRCYAHSAWRTAVVVSVNALHLRLRTYTRAVDAYIALNNASRDIFRRAAIPEHKLFVKSNFVPATSLRTGDRKRQAIFVGAITRSKGVHLLLEAWARAALTDFNLLLVGEGPERKELQRQYAQVPNVMWTGRLEREEGLAHVASSRLLVFPSLAYENCPMVLLEALSVGTPAVVANHPTLRMIVCNHREGLTFQAGDAHALAAALRQGLLAEEATWSSWSRAARQAHGERYSDAVNYPQLISIYRTVIERRTAHAHECEPDATITQVVNSHYSANEMGK